MCSTWKFVEVQWSSLTEGNVRLVKSCEWLLQPVQEDYKPITLPYGGRCGLVVKASDFHAGGHGFNSRSGQATQ